jgi:hypothetical protein
MKTEDKIDDLTYDVIWMSMRFWMDRSEKDYPWIKDYPINITRRFWGKLNDLQRKKQISDVEHEIEYSWDADHEKHLQDLLDILNEATNGYNENPDNYNQEYIILDDFDFIMLRMAILYACPRKTISCSMLPQSIIKNRYKLFSKQQIKTIINDLNDHLNWCEKNGFERIFGDKDFDDNVWKKFLLFLDESNRYIVLGTDDKKYLTFCFNNIYYPVERYIKNPHINCYFPHENIKDFWSFIEKDDDYE